MTAVSVNTGGCTPWQSDTSNFGYIYRNMEGGPTTFFAYDANDPAARQYLQEFDVFKRSDCYNDCFQTISGSIQRLLAI
jgi:hypothetical protein